jgi:hypothetical protein
MKTGADQCRVLSIKNKPEGVEKCVKIAKKQIDQCRKKEVEVSKTTAILS